MGTAQKHTQKDLMAHGQAGRQRREAHPCGAILQAELSILPINIHKQLTDLPQHPHCREGS